jgi:hypothetical protein
MCRFMLSSRTIRRVSCLSLWSKLEIALSRNDHFFGNGLSSSSFLFPPNVKHDVLDISVLFGGRYLVDISVRRPNIDQISPLQQEGKNISQST